jgi:hypothetical protein
VYHPPTHWHELARSPAAAVVGELAAASGLGFAHFEHTVSLPEPEVWAPRGRPDLGEVEGWRAGVLPETKFRHFRLDRMVAGFHPGHRAKWSSHELLHRLVGFAWTPGASPLWIACAARLAELLPVALWYHLDEIGLRRCDDHAGGGPLFDAHCGACEAAAEHGPVEVPAERVAEALAAARAFVDRERDGVRRSLREGRPISTRWATIDLCSDGLAWAAAHGARLASPEFAYWVERFFVPGEGWQPTIEALDARVSELFDAIASAVAGVASPRHGLSGRGAGGPPPATPPDPAALRRRWIAGDVAWRLLTVRADCDGAVAEALDAAVDQLADTHDVATAIASYVDLHEDFEVPAPEDVFAVGYDLGGGHGRSVRQIGEGLRTATPVTLSLLGEAADAIVAEFVAEDTLVRAPIGRRFAAWLAARHASGYTVPLASLDAVALESSLVHAPPPDPAVATLSGGPVRDARCRMAPGVARLQLQHEPGALLRGRARRLRAPVELAVIRQADGEVEAVQLSPRAAAASEAMRVDSLVPDVPDEEREALLAAGVWRPEAWR